MIQHENSWQCGACGQSVDSPLRVCWNCGTSFHGELNPNFRPERDADDISAKDLPSEQTSGARLGTTAHFLAETFLSLGIVATIFWIIISIARRDLLSAFAIAPAVLIIEGFTLFKLRSREKY